jgi:hypothetical protein
MVVRQVVVKQVAVMVRTYGEDRDQRVAFLQSFTKEHATFVVPR